MKRQILDSNFWLNQREIVKISYDFSEHWCETIERFKNRIEDFYFTPIETVKEPNKLKGEGFSILTIQCALIEMFAAFKYGKIHKHNKNDNDPSYTYKRANDCFIPFLQTEPIFKNHFYLIDNNNHLKDKPFSAIDFYNKVRCGLMHEARTKDEWVINAKFQYQGNETIFIIKDAVTNKICIDRTILNNQLKKYFRDYLDSLRQKNNNGNEMRRLLGRKLDHLYDIPPDINNFEWWNDN